MNCASYAALLDGYVDGVLTPQEQQAVEQHLSTCPLCAQYLEDCLAMADNFPSFHDVIVPAGFAQSVMEQVAQHPRKSKKTRQWHRLALPAVACLAIVVYVGGDLLPSTHTESALSAQTVEYSMAESAVEHRAVAEIPNTAPESVVMDSATDSAYYFPQSHVGDLLSGYEATALDDGSLGYTLTQEDFMAFVAQVEPNTLHWPEQVTYHVVVVTP